MFIFYVLKKIANFLLDFFLPKYCCHCKKIGPYLCDFCYEHLHFLAFPVKLKLEHIYLDQLIAVTEYAAPISSLIYSLKYKKIIGIAQYCAELIFNTTSFPKTTYITAVPLHPRRLAHRGFNQSEEIARALSQLTGTPYQPLLERTQFSTPQAKIKDRQKRLSNLESAYRLSAPAPPLSPQDTILIIDDVTTTGTTLNECAKILKANGAGKVVGLVLAHGN